MIEPFKDEAEKKKLHVTSGVNFASLSNSGIPLLTLNEEMSI